jgi:DNA (cytosine-5)-methyltransferase 1
MNVGSLFTGIGGLDLGLERAGMRVIWQCESDPYCQRVLRKHWPGLPLYEDVQTLTAPERVDLLAGGFPCQDVSVVGRRAGIDGQRSGLWTHFARLIRELRPGYVLVENVPGLLVRGMGRVLGDLAASGYDAEWDCLPAAAFGAPHLRARIFVLAYPNRRLGQRPDDGLHAGRRTAAGGGAAVADAEEFGGQVRKATGERPGRPAGGRDPLAYANGQPLVWTPVARPQRHPWATEPDVGRVAHGVPARVDRLRALGNAVVPQVAEWIGRQILEAERMRPAA